LATGTRIGVDNPAPAAPALWREQDWTARLEQAIERGANHLLSIQQEQGFWQGELEADTTLESDYI
jgi:Squalene-hopene cyclase N-terminal domain